METKTSGEMDPKNIPRVSPHSGDARENALALRNLVGYQFQEAKNRLNVVSHEKFHRGILQGARNISATLSRLDGGLGEDSTVPEHVGWVTSSTKNISATL